MAEISQARSGSTIQILLNGIPRGLRAVTLFRLHFEGGWQDRVLEVVPVEDPGFGVEVDDEVGHQERDHGAHDPARDHISRVVFVIADPESRSRSEFWFVCLFNWFPTSSRRYRRRAP